MTATIGTKYKVVSSTEVTVNFKGKETASMFPNLRIFSYEGSSRFDKNSNEEMKITFSLKNEDIIANVSLVFQVNIVNTTRGSAYQVILKDEKCNKKIRAIVVFPTSYSVLDSEVNSFTFIKLKS